MRRWEITAGFAPEKLAQLSQLDLAGEARLFSEPDATSPITADDDGGIVASPPGQG